MGDTIYYRTGVGTKPVVDFLAEFLKSSAGSYGAPLLSWLEPVPAPTSDLYLGPAQGFPLFTSGFSRTVQTLDEARLFWKDRAMHVVSGPASGCRFFEYADVEFPGCEQKEIFRLSGQSGDEILLRLDWERFGLRPVPIKKVKVIRYLDGVNLFAWRLIPGG